MPHSANQQSVLNILENLTGLDPLKELFWHQLNYERINEPISRKGWNEPAAKASTDIQSLIRLHREREHTS